MNRILVILLALDLLVYAIAVLGDCQPYDSMSGAAYRTEQDGKILGKFFRPKIDWLFAKFGDHDHCRVSHENEVKRRAAVRQQGGL